MIDRLKKKFLHDKELNQILSSGLWFFFERIFRLVISLVIGLWVARYLGPSDYGSLSYVLAWVSIFGAFAWLGVDPGPIRDLASGQGDRNQILGTVFVLRAAGSILAAAGAVTIGYYKNLGYPMIQLGIAIFSINILFGETSGAVAVWFQSQTQGKPIVLARNIPIFLMQGVRVILIVSGASWLAFIGASTAEVVLGGVALFLTYHLYGFKIREWRFDIVLAKQLLKEGFPIMVSGLIAIVYMRLAQIMLKSLSDLSSVGLYAASARFSEIWWLVPSVIMQAVVPKIFFAGDLKTLGKRAVPIFALMFWTALPIAIVMSFLSDWLVPFILGEEYSHGGPILAVHVWSAVFVFLDAAAFQYLVAKRMSSFLVFKSVLGLSVNVAVNFVLIPKWGALGASFGTVAGYLFSGCISYWLTRPTREIAYEQIQGILLPVKWLFGRNRSTIE